MSATAPVFKVISGPNLLAEVTLNGQSREEPSFVLPETTRVVFIVEPREMGLEYEVRIGDYMVPGGRPYRGTVEWQEDAHFDSARGLTPIYISSRPEDTSAAKWSVRARMVAAICPSKITENGFQVMLNDLSHLAVGLVYDLVSKSMSGISIGTHLPVGAISTRSAQMELRVIEHLWKELGRRLARILEHPATSLKTRQVLKACVGSERLASSELLRLAARGIDPRRKEAPRPFTAELHVVRHTAATSEHRTISAFLTLLLERVNDCLRRARQEIDLIERDRWFRDKPLANGESLYETMDMPRISKLEDAVLRAERLVTQISLARRSFPNACGERDLLGMTMTPIFRNLPNYLSTWRLMRNYLTSSLVTIDAGLEERSKQTWRMYEQWVFLQLAAALRIAGLRCRSQRDFVYTLARDRFTVDLQRGTRLVFATEDERRIVLRYEPWVFSRKIAEELGETIFHGVEGETPWSPDILMEILLPTTQGGFRLDYAIVVDAKYVRRLRNQHREDTLKYMKIRNVETREVVVRQVWLASPTAHGIIPDDESLAWTEHGPSARREEFVFGSLGLSPGEDEEGYERDPGMPVTTARQFIAGILTYLEIPTHFHKDFGVNESY